MCVPNMQSPYIPPQWLTLERNGETGFGGDILIMDDIQGRVYPIKDNLWRWEVRSLVNRHLKAAGTAKTKEIAQRKAEDHWFTP
jgi:hypothetical protein